MLHLLLFGLSNPTWGIELNLETQIYSAGQIAGVLGVSVILDVQAI